LVCEGSLCRKKLPDVSRLGLGEAERYREPILKSLNLLGLVSSMLLVGL